MGENPLNKLDQDLIILLTQSLDAVPKTYADIPANARIPNN
jgi:hypothetical protein